MENIVTLQRCEEGAQDFNYNLQISDTEFEELISRLLYIVFKNNTSSENTHAATETAVEIAMKQYSKRDTAAATQN